MQWEKDGNNFIGEKKSFVLAICVAEVIKDAASHLKAEKDSRLIVL